MFKYQVEGNNADFRVTFFEVVRAWNRRDAIYKAVALVERNGLGVGTDSILVRRRGINGWKTLCRVGYVM